MTLPQDNRWEPKPRLAAALRLAIYVAPFLISALAIRTTQALVGALTSDLPWLLTVLASVLVAAAALVVSGRLMRRLLPLAVLLKLSLFFPDQVPSRFGVALRAASPRRLARQLESADVEQASVAERVLALVSSLAAHDRRTRGHSERVRALTMLIADQTGIAGEERDKLEWASLLHDLGKLDVPSEILNKKGRPSDDEWAILRQHPAGGPGYASGLAQWMGPWIHAMDQHHERYDGTGYPNGITAEDITLSGRIVAVADAFEVMTATRSYKKPMSTRSARTELVACAGTHFDPNVVRAFMQITIGDLHKALGPLSWLGSIPLVGPAAHSISAVGSGVVLGGSAYPALAAAAALTLLSSVPSQGVDQRTADVLAATDAPVADVGPVAAIDESAVPNAVGAAPFVPVIEMPPDPELIGDTVTDVGDAVDDDGPEVVIDEVVDEVIDEVVGGFPDEVAEPVEQLVEDILDIAPKEIVPDEVTEQVADLVDTIGEISAPIDEAVQAVETEVPDDATDAIAHVLDDDEPPLVDPDDLLGGLG